MLAAAQGPSMIPRLVTEPWVQLTTSPTEMVVEFITHDNPKITIEAPGMTVRKVENMVLKTDDLQLQKFAIGGIKPGGTFSYSLVEGTNRMKYTAHAPKGRGSASRITLFGDSGLGTAPQNEIAAKVEAYDPDVIVHLGDVALPFGQEPAYLSNHFAVYHNILSKTPVVAAAGEHDTTYRDFVDTPAGLCYYKFFNLPKVRYPWARDLGNYSFGYGDAYWLILDSNTYNNWRDPRAVAFVKEELAKGSKYPFRFVAFHHAPWHSSKFGENDTWMRALDPLFIQAKVQAVFSGHVHNYQRSKPVANGPTYIVSAASGSELQDQTIAADKTSWKPYTQAFAPGFSFTELEIDKGSATLRQVGIDGATIDTVKFAPMTYTPELVKPTKPTPKKPASKKKKKG